MRQTLKDKYMRIIFILLAVTVLFTVITGCVQNADNVEQWINVNRPDTSFDTSEYLFTVREIPLLHEMNSIGDIAALNEKLYFVSNSQELFTIDEYFGYRNSSDIYTINFDGTDLCKLKNYTPPVKIPHDTYGSASIYNMRIDSDGNIWVYENWRFYIYDLPANFNANSSTVWDYEVVVDSGNMLRKLDSTGAEILSISLDNISNDKDFFIYTFDIDSSGNIYLATNEWDYRYKSVYVLDNTGQIRFILNRIPQFNRFIRTGKGQIAIAGGSESERTNGQSNLTLQLIDTKNEKLNELFNVPDVSGEVFSAGGYFDIFISDNNDLYGYAVGENATVKLHTWFDGGFLDSVYVSNMVAVSDDCIVVSNDEELISLIKTPCSEIPEKTILTLASFNININKRKLVAQFNRTSCEYKIEVTDYREFSTDDNWTAGLNRLITEIASGNVPDILDITFLPFDEYTAKGMLVDLYPYIDSDPDYNRDNFVESVFRASEINGSLYRIFETFMIETIIGHPSIVGTQSNWSMDEFITLLNAHPEADRPFGQHVGKEYFLSKALSCNIEEYIDWNTGEVKFDNSEFIKLLELTNKLPISSGYDGEPDSITDIATGRQIMEAFLLPNFYWLQYYRAMFGGDIIFKGYPSDSGNGNSFRIDDGFAIMTASPNKDGAWKFIKTMLDVEWQLRYENMYGFPTNKTALDCRINEAINNGFGKMGIDSGMQIKPLTQEQAEEVFDLINSTSSISAAYNPSIETIMNIITESASDYFHGTISAEDAARVIQSKVSILVAERS